MNHRVGKGRKDAHSPSTSMMDMKARNQYLHTLITKRKGYHLKPKKEKSALLDEYCRVTGQHRVAVSKKIRSGVYVNTMRYETGKQKRTRTSPYTGEVTTSLITLWEMFDHPCGQRLVEQIRAELPRLRRFREIVISNEMAERLLRISARTIDTKLKNHKTKEFLKRKYEHKLHPLLYQKIPVKLSSDQGRGIGESIQIDCVEHCGQSADGLFLYTVSVTDIGSGWWEGEPVMGRSAWCITQGLGRIQHRFPFPWKEIHTDNGTEFINDLVWRYSQRNGLDFSRSRPYAKNDNCFVEQKNGTHVRKIVGYHRYDTREEHGILAELYRNNLRLYKNFFQPIIPLLTKERIGSHIRRKYGTPKTPYQRILEDRSISQKIKNELIILYESLNPAQLKRNIEKHQDLLYRVYLKKRNKRESAEKIPLSMKKFATRSKRKLIAEPIRFQQEVLIA